MDSPNTYILADSNTKDGPVDYARIVTYPTPPVTPARESWLRENGIASGYPSCCIDWFVNVWQQAYMDVWLWPDRVAPETRNAVAKVRSMHWGYVPCPSCIAADNRIEAQ